MMSAYAVQRGGYMNLFSIQNSLLFQNLLLIMILTWSATIVIRMICTQVICQTFEYVNYKKKNLVRKRN